MLLAAAAALAIVTQDSVPLRASPSRAAQQQATLWQGDTLEVRGERLDYLRVYDHRRERAGYVHGTAVQVVNLEEAAAPELLATLRFLRDKHGSESLGIAYAAAYLKAAPAKDIGAEAFAALGTMADRLASRASRGQGSAGNDPKLAAHLDIAASYGVTFTSFERDGRVQLCYEGDALRRVLALPANPHELAQAALALTRHECLDPALSPTQINATNAWRAEVLDRVDLRTLPLLLKNRLRLRRAGVWAALAFAATRTGESSGEAGARAFEELAGVVASELAEGDRDAYTEAAVRVGASRWASEPEPGPERPPRPGLTIATQTGAPGETCVLLLDDQHDATAPLARRCTYGTVWTASATPNPAGTALALAVQPLEVWREVWVFRKVKGAWTVNVLPPATSGPDLGYAEFAGWVPGKPQLLVAREARVDGRWQRSFELVRLDTLTVIRRADDPAHLSTFYRWQSPAWRELTVSLR